MKFSKKLLISLLTVILTLAVTIVAASACTMLYVGSDLTATGDTYMSRSEDYSNSYNKIAYVSEHGKHPAGSTYEGCYFSFTFTHDSYAYTAVSDDNVIGTGNPTGECPNCGKTHQHTPMEEGGTNEMGLSISAMDSVYGNSAVKKVDPLKRNNCMNEGDMNTILLGECATAKEAVDLLLSIYDEYGVNEGSGLQISDQKETWYVENYSGTQYVAIKLSPVTVAFNANVGIVGLVDLDDTDNVIASAKLIEVAKEAGTFVGDEEANVIDFRASYSSPSLNSRVWNGLNYLCGVDTFTQQTTTPDDITITNIKDGEIVPVYSNIQLKDKFTTKDMVDFYKVNTIGKSGNLEWHIFQINANGPAATSIIEWQGINHGGYSVAIPYYPLYTTDVYDGYKVGGIGGVSRANAVPEGCTGYYVNGTKVMVYPEGWENGVYWTNDLLSNYADSAACSAEDNAMVKASLAMMQQKCYDKQAEMAAKLAGMDADAAKVYCTEQSAALAKEAHTQAVALYKDAALDQHVFENGVCTLCGEKDKTFNPFEDVADNAFCKDAVLWAFYNEPFQIAAGFDASHFAPGAVCTRAQAVTMLWRAAGYPAPEGECPFADVSADSVYCDAITWAFEQGIIKGYSADKFVPNGNLTRAQAVTIMWRANGNSAGECPFVDVDKDSGDFAFAIAWAYEEGIAKGVDATHFAPDQNVTRGQFVTFMFRAANVAAEAAA